MLRVIFAAVTAAIALPSIAIAEEDIRSGNYFVKACSKEEASFDFSFCAGYMAGVRDQNDWLKSPIACIPQQVTVRQLLKITMKYLNEHPEELHQSYVILVNRALETAFPCKQEK